MKYILILVLLTFSLCEDEKKQAVGSWTKHSFNENSLEIEQSFRQAAKDYCKTHDVEPDDLIRLTVYSQLVNGVNYKITFMDPSSDYPTIEEYRIYKARGNKPEDYKVEENTKYENTLGGLILDYNGSELRCGSGFTDEERDEIWKMGNDVIGMMCEISYMEETKTGSLRHPVFERFRFDLEE